MNETLTLLIEIISAIATLTGILILNLIAWKKSKPETHNIEQESAEHEANAAASALASTEVATRQLYATQLELYKERDERKKLEEKVKDLENLINCQKVEFDKTFRKQKYEFDLIVGKQNVKIMMLSNQVVQLGGTPIAND